MRHDYTGASHLMSRRLPVLSLALLASLLLLAATNAAGKPAAPGKPVAQGQVEFLRDIQPLLVKRCGSCHSGGKQQGGFRLDTPEELLRGGDSGPAVRPGKSAESLLIRLVTGGVPGKVMPPAGPRLTPAEVSLLRCWIDAGASVHSPGFRVPGRTGARSDPGRGTRDYGPAEPHWAFRPVRKPPVPTIRKPQTPRGHPIRNPIDAFILARLQREGLWHSPEAGRESLIRRLSLDLLGLPPSVEEVDQFLADKGPDAYERLVDRLLASPHFGERWGRHWLDLARYADSDGYEKDSPRPYAYLYRDWVIDAINRDLPFDRFAVEQIAGDRLPDAGLEQRIATGFHRQTLRNREGGADQEEDRVKNTADRANTVGTVFLGLTVGCAQCHSHKYDPISQREYFGLYAFFNSAEETDLPAATEAELTAYREAKASFDAEHAPLAAAVAAFEREQLPARVREWEARVRQSPPGDLPGPVAAALRLEPGGRTAQQQADLVMHYRTLDPELKRLDAALAGHAKKAPKPPERIAMTLSEAPKPRATRIHVRGDFLRPGEEVRPHTPAVLPALQASGEQPSRLDLARWIVHPDNPLTPRVTVNRVWQHLFGRGLVGTPDDFGMRGEKPTHPELLDWLATTFVAGAGGQGPGASRPGASRPDAGLNWSLKGLIRLIVTSSTYRQESSAPVTPQSAIHNPQSVDPKNLLLSRQNRFRPEAEIVRDLHLAASGLLNRESGGPSIRPPLPADIAALGYAGSVRWPESKGRERYKRGMYIFFQRTVPYPMLATFDAPDSNAACTRRERSNTPLQALTLLNDPVFFECAQALGARIVKEGSKSVEGKVRYAVRVCLAREPTRSETARLARLYRELVELVASDPEAAAKLAGLGKPEGCAPAEAAAWVGVARAILNLDEFVTRE